MFEASLSYFVIHEYYGRLMSTKLNHAEKLHSSVIRANFPLNQSQTVKHPSNKLKTMSKLGFNVSPNNIACSTSALERFWCGVQNYSQFDFMGDNSFGLLFLKL